MGISLKSLSEGCCEYLESLGCINLDKEKDILKIFDGIGKKIGAMKNNEIDYDKVYDRIIRDLKEGYLGNVTFDNVK